jgi:SSS family solute:Na+ symporter
MELRFVDYSILGLYAFFVLAVGFALKGKMHSSEDFFLSGRSLPSWITGLAFLAANLGALEVMGMAANGAKYGMLTNHFYWVGAIPAMVFLALFMMPFYYGSRVRSVPEYLKLRFDERTRGLNAISFAVMTVMMSGINMYAMALVLNLMLGWSIDVSILLSAAIVLVYIFFGGLTSSIYNEVLQFFLIVFGLLPMAFLGLSEVGGFAGLEARLPEGFVHTWSVLSEPERNPMGVGWFGTVMGLGFVLSFGYWCTDFLVVQRALASKDLEAAQRTPLIAAVPKMLFPLLVILPGLVALATIPEKVGENYNMSFPLMLERYYPPGLLGLGLTALLASFMSGMAGNVTAFNTVWTYDIYQAYLRPRREDWHYLRMGKAATVFGTLISVGTAYLVLSFNNLMDYMQLLFSFFNAPLFATFLLGMFWARATSAGAFYGLLSGILAAGGHYLLVVREVIPYRSDMTANFFGAITAWTVCFLVTIGVSLLTRPKPRGELEGLVYSVTPQPGGRRRWSLANPKVAAIVVLAAATVLNLWFW